MCDDGGKDDYSEVAAGSVDDKVVVVLARFDPPPPADRLSLLAHLQEDLRQKARAAEWCGCGCRTLGSCLGWCRL